MTFWSNYKTGTNKARKLEAMYQYGQVYNIYPLFKEGQNLNDTVVQLLSSFQLCATLFTPHWRSRTQIIMLTLRWNYVPTNSSATQEKPVLKHMFSMLFWPQQQCSSDVKIDVKSLIYLFCLFITRFSKIYSTFNHSLHRQWFFLKKSPA